MRVYYSMETTVRSETCAVCGELGHETEMYLIEPYQQYEACPEAFDMIGRMFTLFEAGYEGSAHFDCIKNFEEILDE